MWKITVGRGRPQMTIWRMRNPCWITKATGRHSEYVILNAPPPQQSLHERASLTLYVRCLSYWCLGLKKDGFDKSLRQWNWPVNKLRSRSFGFAQHAIVTQSDRWVLTFRKYIASIFGDTLWRSWLGQCATSRKFAVSIPDGVNGIFHRHNPSGSTKALGSTQPLTEMSTRNISRG